MADRAVPGAATAPAPVAMLLAAADALAVLGGWLAAGCLAALVLLISAEILVAAASRVFPSLPGDIPIAWEYSAYLMGAAFLLGAAVTLRAGGHIRVSILVSRLGPGPLRALEIVTALLGSAVTIFFAWSLLLFAWRSFTSGQVSGGSFTPLWIPQAALAAGAVLLAIQMVARLARSLLGLATEDHALKAAGLAE
jgi:TRAP-type mannitol/chloroaromatic compound transport system permease small subunit